MSHVAVITDDEVGFYGGYRLERDGELIGRVERFYPTWERKTKGRRYVNARGKCKRAEYRALKPGDWGRGVTYRTLRDAVAYLAAEASALRSVAARIEP